MDIIKKMLKELNDNEKNDIYLREIAHLMEEIDVLKGKIEVKDKLIEKYVKIIEELKS